MKFRVQIHGAKEISQKLGDMDRKLQRVGLIKAVKAGSEIIVNDMIARAPVDTGDLKDSITTKFTKRGIRRATQEIGPDKDHAWYAKFNELGTAHQPARPFIAPSLEQNTAQVQSAVSNELWNVIEQSSNG